MPNRDYATPKARSKSKKNSSNKMLILSLLVLILLLSAIGLWLLKAKAPVEVIPTQVTAPTQPKSTLPSRPEEVYSYIRELETREVPIDKNARIVKLTAEQEKQLAQQREEEKRRLEAAAQKSEPVQTTPNPPEAVVIEEKPKPAENKKPEEPKAKVEKVEKVEQAKPAIKNEEPAKPVAGKFGLQCGAFKNKAQAENMQARLAMAGYNARITTNAEWNRVFVGPIGDRAAAVKAQGNVKSVAECLVVAM